MCLSALRLCVCAQSTPNSADLVDLLMVIAWAPPNGECLVDSDPCSDLGRAVGWQCYL